MGVVQRPAAVARLLDQIGALERAYSRGHHGRWSASRRAGFVDACLLELFASSDPPPGVALGMKPNPVWLKAGDIVTLGIQGLGEQRQKIVKFRM